MTRLRVEGLLTAFPKLLDGAGKDHTYIETESVRYVYQPMEQLYLVIITNRTSNILEDLETLRLIAKVVQDVCQTSIDEALVIKNAFDLIFAFDEVISFGYRESVTLSQIKTYTEMDSHEEKLHQMIQQSKINEAKEQAKKKQQELAKQRAAQAKEDKAAAKLGGGSGGGGSSDLGSLEKQLAALQTPSSNVADIPPAAQPSFTYGESAPVIKVSGGAKKGMQIGKKKPAAAEMGAMPVAAAAAAATPAAAADAMEEEEAKPAFNPLLEPVAVQISEQMSATLQPEGGLVGDIKVNGTFQVTVLDTSRADLVAFKVSPQDSRYKFKVHPNLNKASQVNNVLEIRDPSRAFRANVAAPLLKWQSTSSDEGTLPLTFECWPSATGDGAEMTLTYELTDGHPPLNDVEIRIPCPKSAGPKINSVEGGECGYDEANQCVVWKIEQVNADQSSGTLEIAANTDSDTLLPLQVTASSEKLNINMDILECYHQTKQEPVKCALTKSMTYSLTIGE